MGTASAVGMAAGLSVFGGTSVLATTIIAGILSGPVRSMLSKQSFPYIEDSIVKLTESITTKKVKIQQLQKEIDEEERLLSYLCNLCNPTEAEGANEMNGKGK